MKHTILFTTLCLITSISLADTRFDQNQGLHLPYDGSGERGAFDNELFVSLKDTNSAWDQPNNTVEVTVEFTKRCSTLPAELAALAEGEWLELNQDDAPDGARRCTITDAGGQTHAAWTFDIGIQYLGVNTEDLPPAVAGDSCQFKAYLHCR